MALSAPLRPFLPPVPPRLLALPHPERISKLALSYSTVAHPHLQRPRHRAGAGLGVNTTTNKLYRSSTYSSGMFRRYAFGFPPVRPLSAMSSTSTTPIEDAIRSKITAALQPSTFEIYNDSHLHSHHKAMVGNTSKETHFRLVITSEAFRSKMQSARHRMIYALLREEMAQEGGIHALQLRTLTPEEEERQKTKAAEQEEQKEQQQDQQEPQRTTTE
ncbi:hypothetical protein jhhlp_000992 [Lomentospora prolificans]|uniref:BolA protein n=1 Tax=Lomentospora prolificans TaxID=41688 RepID=A0A2N3NK45_9PEZI|nr:hypothetical protein jhhlp_000992 [Lomentospora prolificans]